MQLGGGWKQRSGSLQIVTMLTRVLNSHAGVWLRAALPCLGHGHVRLQAQHNMAAGPARARRCAQPQPEAIFHSEIESISHQWTPHSSESDIFTSPASDSAFVLL